MWNKKSSWLRQGVILWLRQALVMLLIFSMLPLQAFGTGSPSSKTTESSTNPVQIRIDIDTIPANIQSQKMIHDLALQKLGDKNTHLVLSSDQGSLLETVYQDASAEQKLKLSTVGVENLSEVPQDVAPTENRFLSLIKNYGHEARESISNDKIGFLVLTFTTTSETLVWIHNSQLSQFERTSNIIYTLALALVFGLNKDKWAQATRPIQNFFRGLLKTKLNDPTHPKEIAVRFLGNLSLSLLVVSGRIPLLSMDEIIHQGIQLHYFTLPLLFSLVGTAASFTWSEHLAMIDEKTQPLTKFIFRRLNEARWIIVGTFATTAALLSPAEHGLAPWIVITSFGIAGASIYLNANPVANWIEKNPKLRAWSLVPSLGLQCRELF